MEDPRRPRPLDRYRPIGPKIGDRSIPTEYKYLSIHRIPLIYQKVSLDIKPGQVTAIVGLNRSGKSTCVKLLERFYQPQAGEILLDGKPLTNYKDQYLHDKVGCHRTFLQDQFLLEYFKLKVSNLTFIEHNNQKRRGPMMCFNQGSMFLRMHSYVECVKTLICIIEISIFHQEEQHIQTVKTAFSYEVF